mmetsp:Transcript_95283/g.187028  ORF Transcript_95283/g.187028 Transcript_95283/m.187028 type:complete len:253 (+) Transcript_95283:1035-1793(+)
MVVDLATSAGREGPEAQQEQGDVAVFGVRDRSEDEKGPGSNDGFYIFRMASRSEDSAAPKPSRECTAAALGHATDRGSVGGAKSRLAGAARDLLPADRPHHKHFAEGAEDERGAGHRVAARVQDAKRQHSGPIDGDLRGSCFVPDEQRADATRPSVDPRRAADGQARRGGSAGADGERCIAGGPCCWAYAKKRRAGCFASRAGAPPGLDASRRAADHPGLAERAKLARGPQPRGRGGSHTGLCGGFIAGWQE